MRILLLSANYNLPVEGGAERSLRFLAEGLVDLGHEVKVASIGNADAKEVVRGVGHKRLRHGNIYSPTPPARARHPLLKFVWHAIDSYNPIMAQRFGAVIDEFGPDLVHTNVMAGVSVSAWPTVKRRGLPLVHTLRDYYVPCARSTMFRNGHPCMDICFSCYPFRWAARPLSQRVDAVVGNSRFILDHHLRLGTFTDTPLKRVIYNGYSPPATPQPPSPESGRLRVGYLGKLTLEKGVEWLLEVFSTLPENEFELTLAGSGAPNYERTLQNRFASEHVRFLGFVPPTQLFTSVDLLVVPSLWPEPLPRTVFEAYGHGIPVLGSDRGGIPEILHHGETGFVFDPDKPQGLLDHLWSLQRDRGLLARLRAGAEAMAGNFLPKRVAREYLELYRAVIKST